MSVPSLAWGRVLAACAVLFTAGLAGDGPAATTVPGKCTAGYCPDATGVTVIVDFQDLGGEPLIRCAPGPQDNGVTAMQNAGLDLAGTGKYGLALICKIEGKPADQSCAGMPPESASWSLWTAANGGKWESSQVGVQGRKPPAGSFEGWSFAHNKAFADYPPPRTAPGRQASAAGPGAGHGIDAPFVFMATLPVLILIVLAELSGLEGAWRCWACCRPSTRRAAAWGRDGRDRAGVFPARTGRAGVRGWVRVCAGATSLFASALLTGGVGPWLPFQMPASSLGCFRRA